MPTFDQLPAEQRAIIELVVQRGRTYDQLADALQITPERVRELAHDALVELSPRSAARVDADRRSQIADYVLNQQSSAESTATRTHLKRSEAGRMWVSSLLDSLEHMYEDGTAPEGPAAEAAEEERPRRRERERERERPRDRERERPRDRERDRGAVSRDRERPAREATRKRDEKLTPEAERAVRNRRIAAVVGALLILGAIVTVLLVVLIDTTVREARAPTTRVVGQLLLNPLERGGDNQGIAIVAQRGDDRSLIVQARLEPNRKEEAYEVWLYNSDKDAVSLGAQVTDKDGNYQGAGRLPAPLNRYKYIDVSLEKIDRNPAHSGNSILRGEVANIQAPTEANQPGAQGQQQPGTPQQPGQQPAPQQPGQQPQTPQTPGQQPGQQQQPAP
jgi:anti-sigma-K factor RskA